VVGRLGPQAVGQLEIAVEVTQAERARKRGQLVDERLRLGFGDGPRDLLRVEGVGDHRLGAELAHQPGLAGAARHPDHLVAAHRQPRQQLLAHRARRSSYQNLHRCLLPWLQR